MSQIANMLKNNLQGVSDGDNPPVPATNDPWKNVNGHSENPASQSQRYSFSQPAFSENTATPAQPLTGNASTQDIPVSEPNPTVQPVATQSIVPSPNSKPDNIIPGTVSDTAGVPQTTTAVLHEANYAGFGKRMAASAIDGLLVTILTVIAIVPLALSSGFIGPASDPESAIAGIQMISNFIGSFISAAYFIIMTGKKGQTFGKMAMGIKVVKKDNHQTPGIVTAFLREIIGKALSSMVICLGYLWMIKDENKQTWHDKIAGTIVVMNK